jgi:copper chaperone CopZ
MLKYIIYAAIFFCNSSSSAQVKKATLQASGLTCSMCSNAINKSLKSLPFVQNVVPNIKNSSFEVTFKSDAIVDFDEIKAKVEDAGFFVSNLSATINFTNTAIENDSEATMQDLQFHFLNVKKQVLIGEHKIRLLDKGFVSNKEFKKNETLTTKPCYKTGKENGVRIFHVTI